MSQKLPQGQQQVDRALYYKLIKRKCYLVKVGGLVWPKLPTYPLLNAASVYIANNEKVQRYL